MKNATINDVLLHILESKDKKIKNKLTGSVKHIKNTVDNSEKVLWIDDKNGSESNAHLIDGIFQEIERQVNKRMENGEIKSKKDYYNFLISDTDEAKKTVVLIIQSGLRDTVRQFLHENDKIRKSEKELVEDVAEEATRRFIDATTAEIIDFSEKGFSNVGRWKNAYNCTYLDDDDTHLDIVDVTSSAEIKLLFEDDLTDALAKIGREFSDRDKQLAKFLFDGKTDKQIASVRNQSLEATQKQRLRLEEKFRKIFNMNSRKEQKEKMKNRKAK